MTDGMSGYLKPGEMSEFDVSCFSNGFSVVKYRLTLQSRCTVVHIHPDSPEA